MNYDELPEFAKEFKKLSKKYLSLSEDIELFCRILEIAPTGNSRHFNVLTAYGSIKVVKARLFCRYLKGSSLRIVYALDEETRQIVFLEVFHKNVKEREDQARIKAYLKALK